MIPASVSLVFLSVFMIPARGLVFVLCGGTALERVFVINGCVGVIPRCVFVIHECGGTIHTCVLMAHFCVFIDLTLLILIK